MSVNLLFEPNNFNLQALSFTSEQLLNMPQLTTTQKLALTDQVLGSCVYDTTQNLINVWTGTAWTTLAAGGGSGSVTSVGVVNSSANANSSFFSLSNTPVTTAGNISLGLNGITTFGTNGQLLSAQGNAFGWVDAGSGSGTCTSVGLVNSNLSVPLFTVSGSPVTTAGNIGITLANITSFGTPGQLLASNSSSSGFSWVNAASGSGTVTSVGLVNSNASVPLFTVSGSPITTTGNIGITLANITTFGTAGQVLTSNSTASGFAWANAASGSGTVTSCGLVNSNVSAPLFTISGSPVTTAGNIGITLANITGFGTAGQFLICNSAATGFAWSNSSVPDPLTLNTINATSLNSTSTFSAPTATINASLECNCPITIHTNATVGDVTLRTANVFSAPGYSITYPTVAPISSTAPQSMVTVTSLVGESYWVNNMFNSSLRGVTFANINTGIAVVPATTNYPIYVKDVLIYCSSAVVGGDIIISSGLSNIFVIPAALLLTNSIVRCSSAATITVGVGYDTAISNANINISSSATLSAGGINIVVEYLPS